MPIRKENESFYPLDWELRSRFVRFVRAGNRCEWCYAANYEPHPVTGSKVVLTTAHIYDEIERPHNLLNLAGLCQRCHLNHDRKKHILNRANNRRNKFQLELELQIEVSLIF